MKDYFCYILLLLYFFSKGQSYHKEGYIEESKDPTTIGFSKSVNSEMKNFLYNCESVDILNNKFEKEFAINGTSFISILPNRVAPRIDLIVENGDNIKMNITKKEGEFEV